jgi:hypothetical protein
MLLLGAVVAGSEVRAGVFLDLASLNSGTNGTFTGTLDGVAVSGSISTTDPHFEFSAIGTDYFHSTTDNSSPQYSYASVYTPTIVATDRVGYALFGGFGVRAATITITFGSPSLPPD